MFDLQPEQQSIVDTVRAFLEREVEPVAMDMEHREEYPHHIVGQMKDLGLFGLTIGEQWGGLGVDLVTYAAVVEEIARVWMAIAGIINSHLIMASIVEQFGTPAQKQRRLPAMATGERRGGLGITEPNAGSDVMAIKMTATRDGDAYVLNGTKLFVSNGRHGNTYAILARTDPGAEPAHRGLSLFIVEKGDPAFVVTRDVEKLGYHGIDTVEFFFDNLRVPAANLVGGMEGEGFKQAMFGLELGRVNVAARGVGVARAAFEAAIRYSQQRQTMGKPICEHQAIQLKLADMATQLQAARLMTRWAAAAKEQGGRHDQEVGMAKLFATEVALANATEALRIHGGYGYTREFPVERYYRDAPMMVVAEGTNEIQRLIIARNLIAQYRI